MRSHKHKYSWGFGTRKQFCKGQQITAKHMMSAHTSLTHFLECISEPFIQLHRTPEGTHDHDICHNNTRPHAQQIHPNRPRDYLAANKHPSEFFIRSTPF